LNLTFTITVVLFLLVLLAWALRTPRRARSLDEDALNFLGDGERPHITHLPQIRQALADADFEFLRSLGREKLASQLSKERRKVALNYLPAVQEDFEKMLHIGRIVAVLSPEVKTVEEWERLRLTIRFYFRYHLIRFALQCGLAPIPQLSELSQLVSALSIRMEIAVKELGERAALAAEITSSFGGGGVNPV